MSSSLLLSSSYDSFLASMGLLEQELSPDPLAPQPIPGGAELLTGDPGARLSNAFSPAVMGGMGLAILGVPSPRVEWWAMPH